MNKVVISGGGTGGHIFPAIAIANEIKHRFPSCEILFIGAKGKMEMDRVPQAGYEIIGLDIRGFQRKKILPNLLLPFKIISSLLDARQILRRFQPEVVIGVGGYASGPTLRMAQLLNIPTVIQEQNSYAGKTNMILGKKAKAICVAYDNMQRFFPKELIHMTGNPVRKDIAEKRSDSNTAKKTLGFDETKKLILVIGGSLGARTINQAILSKKELLAHQDVEILWQTGKFYIESIEQQMDESAKKQIKTQAFIDNMSLAYSAADLIVSRAGALSISELCLVRKPIILVPSPNVAEDHQTQNALALSNNQAALLIKDKEAADILLATALELVHDEARCQKLSESIHNFAKPNATQDIVDIIQKIAHGSKA